VQFDVRYRAPTAKGDNVRKRESLFDGEGSEETPDFSGVSCYFLEWGMTSEKREKHLITKEWNKKNGGERGV